MMPSCRSLLMVLCGISSAFAATSPPEIKLQPEQMSPFKIEESIELSCDAKGVPRPNFNWQKDGIQLDVSGNDNRFTQQPGKGTIVINKPLKKDEGVYQCFASNNFGVAVTQKTILRVAQLDRFPTVSKATKHTVNIGDPVTLSCTPPYSFPDADLYWIVLYPDGSSRQLPLSNRITMDRYGNLHFTNVMKADQDGGKNNGEMVTYRCTANNRVERKEVSGDDQQIEVIGDTTTSRPPLMLWHTPSTKPTAVRKTRFILKCIFSGEPTPKVTWVRKENKPMPQPPRVYKDSYGQELVFTSVEFSDAGKYECEGKNDLSANPMTKPFEILVESKPFWTRKLENAEKAENESATFHCKADGIPQPRINWFINGIDISKVPNPKRIQIDAHTIKFVNLTTRDAQVIQCNASNSHGYTFASAYLNVLAIPPEFKAMPPKNARFAEGSRVNMTCQTYAAPKAQVSWIKDGRHLTGGRYKVHTDGNLEILGVKSNDAGFYKCTAKNKFGSVSGSGKVSVRQATRIVSRPENLMINAGDEAKLVCTATTDPAELENLSIEWLRDGTPINYQLAQRIFQNSLDNSLTVTGARKTDTAVYTCVAKTPLDKAEVHAFLTVRDRPNAPAKVKVDCKQLMSQRKAIIQFEPNGANYAPVLEFMVQYNTTFTPDVWSLAMKVDENKKRVEFKMSPWATYSFRVIARNRLGLSEPSEASGKCETQKDVPYTAPSNVKVEGTESNNLVIYWTPMPQIEFNAPGFVYLLEWECLDDDCKDNVLYSSKATIGETWRKEHIIKNQKTYRKYKVTVTCRNEEGISNADPVPVIGYSGEGIPQEKPTSFQLNSIDDVTNTAKLQWKAVANDTKLIQGFFVGYLVQYWKVSEGAVRMRQAIVDINKPVSTPDSNNRQKRAVSVLRKSGVVVAEVTDLPAYSEIEMQVSVLNDKYQGQASDKIRFKTKEGVPGPVDRFRTWRRNSNMLEFRWELPTEPNGILVGYDIAYRAVKNLDLGDRSWRVPITDPNQLRANVSGLRPEQMYRVYIYAKTKKGRGQESFVDARTTSAGAPSPPTFIIPEVNKTSMNVTWEPSRSGNPGSVFYVQYRKEGKYQWETTAVETVHNFINVTGMSPGTRYEVRVVSRNGQDQEAASLSQYVITRGYSASRANITGYPWFYLMLLSVFLLIIALIVILYIRKKVKPRYPEQEDENRAYEEQKLRPEYRGRDDRYAHEYVKNAAYEKSQDSLNKEPIPDDPYVRRQPPPRYRHDSDEVTEPMHPYREDGSYVGEYRTAPEEKTMQGPQASSTFV